VALAAALLAAIGTSAHAEEFGTGPWPKGYTDIFSGILPPVPGIYIRNDAYHYDGTVDATIFNGRVQVGVEEKYLADIFAATYVTSAKFLGGTYAFAAAPSVVNMNVDVGLGIRRFNIPVGPVDLNVGPFSLSFSDSELALGDTAFAPLILGWSSGNLYWNFALFGFAPTGDYNVRQLANTSLNHWAVMPHFAATYFDPKTLGVLSA
jgi:hypothetical protein